LLGRESFLARVLFTTRERIPAWVGARKDSRTSGWAGGGGDVIVFDLRVDDYWIMATGALCNVSCGLLGCYLVLRRMSLLGDAISHAVLPGLAAAFLLFHTRASVPMLLGAMAVGVLTAFLTSTLHRWGKVPEDASMGVVFTSLFAIGVILITRFASDVDLDPGCVLYGLIEFVPLDLVRVAGINIPRSTLFLGLVLLCNVVLITLFYKELKIVSFDPYLATTMGISATAVHYGLMAATAATTVASFEAAGSILVVAMLIAPGATAHLLTDRLSRMLVISAVVAGLAAVFGHLLAIYYDTSVAGMMSVVVGVEFVLAVFLAPRHGYVSKLLHRASLSLRIVREDVLGMLYRWQEAETHSALHRRDVLAALGGGVLSSVAVRSLIRAGQVRAGRGDTLSLTEGGLGAARGLVRSHRLWESYLAKHLDLPLDHLHAPAERMEHFITPRIEAQLTEEIQSPSDPHGRRIPADDTDAGA